MNLYVRIDGKGDAIYEVVAFVGGDYNPWAILRGGERLWAEPLNDLRIVSDQERYRQETDQRLAEAGY